MREYGHTHYALPRTLRRVAAVPATYFAQKMPLGSEGERARRGVALDDKALCRHDRRDDDACAARE